MKFVMLAHPPNPNPTTNTHTTINAFTMYIAVQLGRKNGGFSAAFCTKEVEKDYMDWRGKKRVGTHEIRGEGNRSCYISSINSLTNWGFLNLLLFVNRKT